MKKTVSRVSTQINANDFQSTGNLPTPESVDSFAASLTSKEPLTTVKKNKVVEFKTYGRPPKEKAIGREAFTTSIHPDFITMLKTRAIKRKCTVADLLETIFSEHLHNY